MLELVNAGAGRLVDRRIEQEGKAACIAAILNDMTRSMYMDA
jgi:hypothetical protein